MSHAVSREALEDALLDLQHDLGKYLRLPLAYLPADADDDALRRAARAALMETRSRGETVVPARLLWRRFVEEARPAAQEIHGFAALEAIVLRALAWEEELEGLDGSRRAALHADLDAVAPAIRALLRQIQALRAPP